MTAGVKILIVKQEFIISLSHNEMNEMKIKNVYGI
jgi:hypothetical protein